MNSPAPTRPEEDLAAWLRTTGYEPTRVTALAGDVSLRRYYRVACGTYTMVAAYYPPELREASARFAATTALLQGLSIRVPRILATNEEGSWMLLEDVGDVTLADAHDSGWAYLRPRLRRASDAARTIATLPHEAARALAPPLGADALAREIEMTWALCLERRGLCGEGVLRNTLRDRLATLCRALEDDGLVPCHRDFMARNLVPEPAGDGLIVLDHQDLRLGPRFYDLASLVNDSLFLTDRRAVEVLGEAVVEDVRYRRSAAQRCLKIAGTFVSFAERGVPRYLAWVGTCLRRFLDHFAQLPEGADLAADLLRLWQPELGGAGLID